MPKVQFIFAIHNHQPVGNFDFVAEEAYQKAYLPFINVLKRLPVDQDHAPLHGHPLPVLRGEAPGVHRNAPGARGRGPGGDPVGRFLRADPGGAARRGQDRTDPGAFGLCQEEDRLRRPRHVARRAGMGAASSACHRRGRHRPRGGGRFPFQDGGTSRPRPRRLLPHRGAGRPDQHLPGQRDSSAT